MGIQKLIGKAAGKAGNTVSKLAVLSPSQLEEVEARKARYFDEKPDPGDPQALLLTQKLLAAAGVEIYNAYLPELSSCYLPFEQDAEYDHPFRSGYNIRCIELNRWVNDREENPLEKLVNVYEVLANENCNIALIFHRRPKGTSVYLGVVNLDNDADHLNANQLINRIQDALRGNFPGARWDEEVRQGIIPCLDVRQASVASISNLPGEKSEKFISQTIEKLLDGIIPRSYHESYSLVLLATPVHDVEQRKLDLASLYSALHPYCQWQTNYTYNESSSIGSSATVGLNVGASAGVQQNTSYGITDTGGTSTTTSRSDTRGDSHTDSTNKNHTSGWDVGMNAGVNNEVSVSAQVGVPGVASSTVGASMGSSFGLSGGINGSDTKGSSVSDSVSRSVARTLGNAVSRSTSVVKNVGSAVSKGLNFGANFARSSSVTATIGKNEGIVQNYVNFNIKHALALLEEQMKRMDLSSALGLWDFAAYVVGEDINVVNNVAHTYLALTQGENSYLSRAAINLWRGDLGQESRSAQEIVDYLKTLRHPVFGLNPDLAGQNADYYSYPIIVNGAASLSGKELAYSLNFPRKSVAGFPIINCTAFGRNIVSHRGEIQDDVLHLGQIFHMNTVEKVPADLSLQSLSSHTFVTGSTGSGKSNTIYRILEDAYERELPFLVIEPAKGEYKNVFGSRKDVQVYGTNPEFSKLLKINPFSFPEEIHILEHVDRLVEIFNACWPMYAAMPAVLKDAVIHAYEKAGWDLKTSENRYRQNIYPTFEDVAIAVLEIINSSEYDNENKGAYKGSLLTRLNALTNGINGLIFGSDEIDSEDLFDRNVIADLSRVGSAETKSLLMGMLLLKLQEYRMAKKQGMNQDLQHLTVLEEAHHLLRRSSAQQSAEGANLAGKSVEMIANAIAEMRTYGEGFIIVDQSPSMLDPSAIRNTNTKIILRLPDGADRELAGKAAGLNELQIEELAKLPTGVAVVYQNEWIEPVLAKIEKSEAEEKEYSYLPKESLIEDIYRLTAVEMLRQEDVFDHLSLKEEYGDVFEHLQLGGTQKALLVDLMERKKGERKLHEIGAVLGGVFPEVRKSMRKTFLETGGFQEPFDDASNQLNRLNVQISNELQALILQSILCNLAREMQADEIYREWTERMEGQERLL